MKNIFLIIMLLCGSICFASESQRALEKPYIPNLQQYVTFFGLGTVELGRDWGIGNQSIHPKDTKAEQILLTSIKSGINVIDTASSYQLSEARIGRYLPFNKYAYLQITKPGEHFILAKDPSCNKPSYDGIYCQKPGAKYDFSRKAIFKDINESLRHLNIKTIPALLHLDSQNAMEILKKSSQHNGGILSID